MKLKALLMTMLMMGTLVLSGVTALVESTTTAEAKVTYVCKLSKKERRAKKWIAMKESGGNYRATNGLYYGRYQLTRSYLKGDYSKANQEKTADRYAHSRYGTWVKAKRHWLACGWF